MNDKKIIFLKYALLEELEMTKKGNVSANQVLTLVNNKKYKLQEAIIFREIIEGETEKSLVNQVMTMEDLANKGYDFYMNTVIIDNCAYRVEEGFKGVLIEEI